MFDYYKGKDKKEFEFLFLKTIAKVQILEEMLIKDNDKSAYELRCKKKLEEIIDSNFHCHPDFGYIDLLQRDDK